jgi:hypothetical protein
MKGSEIPDLPFCRLRERGAPWPRPTGPLEAEMPRLCNSSRVRSECGSGADRGSQFARTNNPFF